MRAPVMISVLLTQENNTNHWSASPILDPWPWCSLQGAMLHDHRREAPRPRTAYTPLDSAELVWVPLGPVKENFNIAFAHFYILNVNQHSSNYLKHMLSTTGPIISTSATSRSQVVAHAEIAWTKRYE